MSGNDDKRMMKFGGVRLRDTIEAGEGEFYTYHLLSLERRSWQQATVLHLFDVPETIGRALYSSMDWDTAKKKTTFDRNFCLSIMPSWFMVALSSSIIAANHCVNYI